MRRKILLATVICALILSSGCSIDFKKSEESNSDTDNISSAAFATDTSSEIDYTPALDNQNTDSVIDTETNLDTDSEVETETDTDDSNENTDSDVDTDEEENNNYELIESSPNEYAEEITGIWQAKYILDSNNNEVDGAELYGSAYKQYGGELDMNTDSSFSIKMGAISDTPDMTGTFTYYGSSDIEFVYNNDTYVTCTRCTINDAEAIAVPITIFNDTFTVFFVRS